jgi:chromosome segregation ATPase
MEFPLQDEELGGDNPATNANRASGSKRSFGDLEDDEGASSGSKKGCKEADEATTAMISSLTESLQSCKDELASCQNELVSAKAEIQKWESAFKNESFLPSRKTPEPSLVIDYIQKLKSSETSLKEQVEIAQMKLAIRDLKSELVKAEDESKEGSGASSSTTRMGLLDQLMAANVQIRVLKEVHIAKLTATEKVHAEQAKTLASFSNVVAFLQEKFPDFVFPPPPPKVDEQKN